MVSEGGSQELTLLQAASEEMNKRIYSKGIDSHFVYAQDTIHELLALGNAEIVSKEDLEADPKLKNLVKSGVENPLPICTGATIGRRVPDRSVFGVGKYVRKTHNDSFLDACSFRELFNKATLFGEQQADQTPMYLPTAGQVADAGKAWDYIKSYHEKGDFNSYAHRDELLDNMVMLYKFLKDYLNALGDPYQSPFMAVPPPGEIVGDEKLYQVNTLSVRRAHDGTVYVVKNSGDTCMRIPKYTTAKPDGSAHRCLALEEAMKERTQRTEQVEDDDEEDDPALRPLGASSSSMKRSKCT